MTSLITRAWRRWRPLDEDAPEPSGAAFHDDQHLIAVTDELLATASHFIETGTYVGDTLHHVATRHGHLQCHSCEPSPKRFARAMEHLAGLENIQVRKVTSQKFIRALDRDPTVDKAAASPVFWFDAHGYGFTWPLRDEVRWATSFANGHVLIDDFEVPGRPEFGFDEYKDQRCAWDFIRSSLQDRDDYRVTFPAYTEHTSRFHPLRGWILISFGTDVESTLVDNELVTHLTLAEADALAAR
ncbi:MAG: hypothetical protein ACI867_001307 [Glaciecola sp.]|jgi:hypothetical protein